MTIETLKSPNPRNRNSISVVKSKFLSVSLMNTLLAILKVTYARRDVILVRQTVPQISLETPSPPPPPQFFLFSRQHFWIRKGKLEQSVLVPRSTIMDENVKKNGRFHV